MSPPKLEVRGLRNGAVAQPTAVDEMHRRVMAITGADPLPYGIQTNRAMLEQAIAAAVSQGILREPAAVDDLFARHTLGLTG